MLQGDGCVNSIKTEETQCVCHHTVAAASSVLLPSSYCLLRQVVDFHPYGGGQEPQEEKKIESFFTFREEHHCFASNVNLKYVKIQRAKSKGSVCMSNGALKYHQFVSQRA